MEKSYFDSVFNHYTNCWKTEPSIYLWDKGPIEKMPYNFKILEFAPSEIRNLWTYATCGMSDLDDDIPIELHMFSSIKNEGIIELLTALTYYHRMVGKLNLEHTVNFGRAWQEGSNCEYGLISLPYLDGPSLETLEIYNHPIKFYWLIPITKAEVVYKKDNGIEALEAKFEEQDFNYVQADRKSVV